MKSVQFFNEEKQAHTALEVFEDSVQLSRVPESSKDGRHKEGDIEVSFKFTTTRGSVPVRLNVGDINEFIEILAAGPKTPPKEETVLDIVRNSLSTEKDEDGSEYITFRTGLGKGSKIQRIPIGEYANIVNALKTTCDKLPQAVDELKSRESSL